MGLDEREIVGEFVAPDHSARKDQHQPAAVGKNRSCFTCERTVKGITGVAEKKTLL